MKNALKKLTVILALTLTALPASAEKEARFLLGGKTAGSKQKPEVIGATNRGCLAGGVKLPQSGPTWQAMRLSRGRNWGHPEMINYLKRISAEVARKTSWKGLYIGDISQPRGGPMISGHASHQVGLDADIWLLPAKNLRLSKAKREKISSLNIRAKSQKWVNSNWTDDHMQVLKIAASDPKVNRILVTPVAKLYMCKHAKGDRRWLQKIRPTYLHNTHFHVRLKCPKGSPTCPEQKPTVAQLSKNSTGCDSNLQWWVTDYLNPPKTTKKPTKPVKKKKHPRQFTMADLPSQCTKVLRSR